MVSMVAMVCVVSMVPPSRGIAILGGGVNTSGVGVGATARRPPARRPPPAGCAGRARNPKGPQITPFCHQMCRHPKMWDLKTGIRHRIPARISSWGSQGPNPNFFLSHFGAPKCQHVDFLSGFRIYVAGRLSKMLISCRFTKLLAPIASDLGPQGPKEFLGTPWAPWSSLGPLGGPKGRLGAPKGPLEPPQEITLLGKMASLGPPWAPWAPENGARGPLGLQIRCDGCQ